MQKIYFFMGLMLFLSQGLFAQNMDNYEVKENFLKNGKLAVIACDATGKPTDKIKGNYLFTINGFEQSLRFNDGIAIVPLPIEKSTFAFFKHKNVNGTHAKLYFVYQNADGLQTYEINVFLLILIPILIILVIAALRKYLILGVILLVIYFYLGYSKGLSIPTFIDSLVTQLKNLF